MATFNVFLANIIILIKYDECQSNVAIPVDFDEYGKKLIDIQMSPGSEQTYIVDVCDEEYLRQNEYFQYLPAEEYLYIYGSSALQLHLSHIETNSTIDPKLDIHLQTYFLVHSGNTEHNKSVGTFHLVASLKEQEQAQSVWIEFNRNIAVKASYSYSNSIESGKGRRYGLQIESSDLPVSVEVRYSDPGIDLYGSTEHDFASYFLEAVGYERKSIIVEAEDSHYVDGAFYFFQVHGSMEYTYSSKNYTLKVQTGFPVDSGCCDFGSMIDFTSAFIIGGSIGGTCLLCLIVACLYCCRHRIRRCCCCASDHSGAQRDNLVSTGDGLQIERVDVGADT